MDGGPKKTAQQIIDGIKAKRKAQQAKPAVPIQKEAAKLMSEPEPQMDSSKQAPAGTVSEKAPVDASALVGRVVRLFDFKSNRGDVAEITSLCSAEELNIFGGGIPKIAIKHYASDGWEVCDVGLERYCDNRSHRFISDDGLLVVIKKDSNAVKAYIEKLVETRIPVFLSGDETKSHSSEYASFRVTETKTCFHDDIRDNHRRSPEPVALGFGYWLVDGLSNIKRCDDRFVIENGFNKYKLFWVDPKERVEFPSLYQYHVPEWFPYRRTMRVDIGHRKQFVLNGTRMVTIACVQTTPTSIRTDILIKDKVADEERDKIK